jgi:alpha-glucosidase
MGGFIGKPTKELFVRWLSLGVFTPFLRNHAELNAPRKEPWSFGLETENLSREWINTRYRFLPYLYSAFYESTQSGLPVARTLAIAYPFDPKVWEEAYQNEYLFGDEILVAPVSSLDTTCKVYFPAGGWYRYSTDEYYEGNTEATVRCPLNDLPVFVKAGSIILFQYRIQSTAEKPPHSVELNVYNGKVPTSYQYYEDDGLTYDYEKGNFYRRQFTFDPANRKITIEKPEGSLTSKFNTYLVVLHDFGVVTTVKVNGHEQEVRAKTVKVRFFNNVFTNGQTIFQY